MKDLDLTPLEQYILGRSADLAITSKRRKIVIVTGLLVAIMLTLAAFFQQSWQNVLAVSLVYIAITILEKVAYANAVLGYKSLIQKLKKRIEELTGDATSQRPNAGDS